MAEDSSANAERVLSFTDHLEELRKRIIICAIFFFLALLASLAFAPRVITLLTLPLTTLPLEPPGEDVARFKVRDDGLLQLVGVDRADEQSTATFARIARDKAVILLGPGVDPIVLGQRPSSSLSYLSPLDPFFLLLKGALLIACIITLPMILYQLWLFIAPGLLQRERRIVRPIIISSLVLFPMGAGFAYIIARATLIASMSLGRLFPSLYPNIVVSHYISFILTLMIVFGIVFEFPLVLVLLARLGVITSGYLAKQRRWAILIIAVVSAVATPTPDPFTMLLMMLPLIILYEVSLWVIKLLEKAGPGADEPLADEVSN